MLCPAVSSNNEYLQFYLTARSTALGAVPEHCHPSSPSRTGWCFYWPSSCSGHNFISASSSGRLAAGSLFTPQRRLAIGDANTFLRLEFRGNV